MQFRVLGPLEVDAGDGPIPLGGPKQRAVLASLLVRANQVVPADVLIGDVWGHESPAQARHILQTYVSSLRKTLGDGRLQGRPPGYLLVVEPLELDALRFDELVAEAKRALPVDPNVAVASLEDALALWRGPALADLEDQPSLVAEAARLDELRVQAQEDRVAGLLAAGAPARALGELEPLLARHPLRESLWGLSMLASYRAGRQADALNAYGRARELLADELGIDPSPELVKLHERILKQDPGLELRGEPLRGYRLLERIGEGTLGVVFRGVQPHVGRDVAVKVLHERIAADPDFVLRFEREAQIAAALEHPHIVPMYDHWREPGRAYLVSRYMRGGSLRAFRERGGEIGRERALGIVAQVAAALGFAHRQGVAHGAVTNSNVLFDGEGNAYLGDFRTGRDPLPEVSDDLGSLGRLARELLGRDAPAALLEVLNVEPDGTGADTVAEVARAALEARPIVRAGPKDDRNPYKGLRSFTEADAVDFFGRGGLTERLIARLNESGSGARFLAVVGPSGSGKSSVVRAGLVPALRRGALKGDAPVVVTDLFPGAHPLDELEAALTRVAVRPLTRLGDLLVEGSRGLLEAADIVAPPDAELVLVVDQFEELFTLTADEREREHVLEALRVACVDPGSRVRVIVTLRADQYDRPLLYPRFGELLADRNETVPPLSADELELAIRRPAERQGMRLESGLVAEMIADVAHQPGGLPLLQYALTELFERRDGDALTLSAYREIDGVTGALSSRADRLYTAADAQGRRAIEQVFLRLVTLGEGRQDTRRRVPVSELDGLDVAEEAVAATLDSYGRHRLLTFDREPSTREPTVEIAHEALLRGWGRLASWIDEGREDIRQNERLSTAAAEWRGSGRDPSFLISGSRLEQVSVWSTKTALALGHGDRAYLNASVEQRDRLRREERARLDREAAIERRSVRRLRALVGVFAVAALIAGSLTVVATDQGGRARREADRAAFQARISKARELAAAAIANLAVDPELSVLLAMEAIEETRSIDGTVLIEAEDALHRAVMSSRTVMTLPGVGGPVAWGVGSLATLSTGDVGAIDIRDDTTGEVLRTIEAGGTVSDLAFSGDGRLVAATTEGGSLEVWEVATGARLIRMRGRGVATGVSFASEAGVVAAAWRKEGIVRVLDASTGDLIRAIDVPHASGTSLHPLGDRVAVIRGDVVVVFRVAPGRPALDGVLVPSTGNELAYRSREVAWSPDGASIASASTFLDVWDAETGHLTFSRFAGVDSVAWSPDSTRLVTGSAGTVRIWPLTSFDVVGDLDLGSTEMQGGVAGVAFAPDGVHVVAGSDRGNEVPAIKVWDVGIEGDEEWANIATVGYFGDIAFLPDGSGIVAADAEGDIGVWAFGRRRWTGPIGPRTELEYRLDLSPDGRVLAIPAGDSVGVFDVATGEPSFSYHLPPGSKAESVDWSPDGRYLAVPDSKGAAGLTILDRRGDVVTVLEPPGGLVNSGVQFGPDGLVAAFAGSGARIWDWRSGRVVGTVPGQGWRLAFEPTGASVATNGGEVEDPTIWDLKNHTGRPLVGHSGEVLGIAYSPDGSIVATGGGGDHSVHLFDARTAEPLLVLRGHPAGVLGLAFSPDGAKLASHSPTLIRIWALDIDDLLEIARDNVTRPLTGVECRRYLLPAECEPA